jgi:hypothetical protein
MEPCILCSTPLLPDPGGSRTSLRLELLNMPKLATKYSRQIVESQVMILTEMKVLYIFTSLAIWCVSGEEWGNGMGRVLCMVVGSLHRIIGNRMCRRIVSFGDFPYEGYVLEVYSNRWLNN